MGGGGGGLFGAVLNIVSFAVPVLRPIAIGYNLINSVANDNPLGLASAAFGAYGGLDGATDFGGASGGEWQGSLDPLGDSAAMSDWAGTSLAGTADNPFLGSEGLQNAVNSDSNAWSNMVGDTVKGLDQSLSSTTAPQALGMFSAPSGGFDTSAINGLDLPDSSSFTPGATETSLNNTSFDTTGATPQQTTPTTLEGIGSEDPFATTEGVNKDYNKLTGYGLDNGYGKGNSGLPIGTESQVMNTWDKLTTPIGGGKSRAPTPLEWGGKIALGLGDLYSGAQARGIMEKQFNAANNWTDPNRARGDTANQLWQQNYQDPMAGYNEFMTGAGREFTDQARAQAAKSGRRGAYLNSGRMNSDLASLFMKNQLNRGNALAQGFASGQNNYSATASAAPGYANMVKNQFSPLGSLFGQWEKYNRLGLEGE